VIAFCLLVFGSCHVGLFFNLAQVGECAFELVSEVFYLEHRSDASHKFEFIDGFAEKIVGAGIDTMFDVAEFVKGRYHYHGNVTGLGVVLQSLADFEATHLRHHNIE